MKVAPEKRSCSLAPSAHLLRNALPLVDSQHYLTVSRTRGSVTRLGQISVFATLATQAAALYTQRCQVERELLPNLATLHTQRPGAVRPDGSGNREEGQG